MKKIVSFLVCCALVISAFTGCAKSNETKSTDNQTAAATAAPSATDITQKAEEQASGIKDAKIGFLAPTLQTEFFIGIDDSLKQLTSEKGWEYVSVSFNNDSATAVTAIENMVTSGCKVIIAMVSDKSCDPALQKAQKSGIKIMEVGVETDVHDVVLNTDQYKIGEEIGEMASDFINNKLGGKGNVVVYTTFQNQDMQNRGQGIQDAIKKNAPNAKILEVVDIGKDVTGAGTTTTETMLQKYPDLNVICSYGDAAAVESMEAVKAAGKASDSFGIFACDGTAKALESINNGDVMRGTIVFDPLGPAMMKYAEKLLQGETFPDTISFVNNKVTSDNISDFYTPGK